MAGHPVAANLLMLGLLIGGFVSAMRVKQEVFPEFTLDVVGISIPYPGASPEEVETGILLSVEDSVRSIEGVKKVTSTAGEGRGSVSVELLTSADIDRALQEVKNAVDRIRTFPEDAERPTVSLIENRNRVLTLAAIGPYNEQTLRNTAERIRDELTGLDGYVPVLILFWLSCKAAPLRCCLVRLQCRDPCVVDGDGALEMVP